jgi:hypothetical protein
MENSEMSNLPVERTSLPAAISFDNLGISDPDVRVNQGDFLQNTDGKWASGSGVEFAHGTIMLAPLTIHAIQHFEFDHWVKEHTQVKRPKNQAEINAIDETVAALNAQIPLSDWEIRHDKPDAPYKHRYGGYLVDPTDAGLYTYLHHTVGAKISICTLEQKIARMSALRGQLLGAVVELRDRTVPGVYKKIGPWFDMIDWFEILDPPAWFAQTSSLIGHNPVPAAPRAIDHKIGKAERSKPAPVKATPVETIHWEEDDEPDVGGLTGRGRP